MFQLNQRLSLPELSSKLGLDAPNQPEPLFAVDAVIKGGMGECARLTHVSSEKVFALKIIQADGLSSEDSFERFRREVQMWSTAASCEAVLDVYAVIKVNALPCVCTKWMDGGDLKKYLSRDDSRFFFSVIDRILAALESVYKRYAIIHRDLKPGNILMDSALRPHLADWGLARAVGKAVEHIGRSSDAQNAVVALTGTGDFLGTLVYAAPEQILDASSVDHRADMYSLGCILYEWEVGRLPFHEKTWEETRQKILECPAPTFGGLFKRTKFGTESIVAKLLAKEPKARYQSYSEIREALRQVANSRGCSYELAAAKLRAEMPLVGSDEIGTKQFEYAATGSTGYGVVDLKQLEPYLKEVDVLCGLGEWKKAHDILIQVYIPEMFRRFPDFEGHQATAVNLALCLSNMGRRSDALTVLDSIIEAKHKPGAYFVNRSLLLNQLGRDAEAAACAREGLHYVPKDIDLLGNLTLALTAQNMFTDALPIAEQRLRIQKDVHSLDEIGLVHLGLAKPIADKDWPSAVKHLGKAVRFLTEAKQLNPRYLSARFNLASAWFRLENYAKSSEEVSEIANLRIEKNWAELGAVRHAECLNRVAAFQQCVEFCDKWLREVPDSVGLQRVRAETIVDAFCIGKEKDGKRIVEGSSLQFFTDVVEDKKRATASDFRYFARLKEWMGEIDTAFELLHQAERIEPESWEVPFNRGVFFWRMGELRTALKHAVRVSELGPWCPQPIRLLATIQDSCGMRDQASENDKRAENLTQQRKQALAAVAP